MALGVYIDGKWSEGSGPRFANACPASAETVWEGNAAGPEDVAAAIASARKSFGHWSRLPQSDRTLVLERYAEEIAKRTERIAETISRDMGKVLWETRAEAATMKAKVAVSIAAQNERAGSKFETAPYGSSHLTHRAHGVMAVFGPFNFPGHLPNGHIVPALLAGNTCVFKPSELAPGVAALMAEAFEAAGLPDGCLNIVHGTRETARCSMPRLTACCSPALPRPACSFTSTLRDGLRSSWRLRWAATIRLSSGILRMPKLQRISLRSQLS